MTQPTLSPQLAAIIRDAIAHRFNLLPFPEIDEDTELSEITDSLDRQTIGFGIEEITGCEVAEWDVMRWRTVADVIATVRAAVAAEQSAKVEG